MGSVHLVAVQHGDHGDLLSTAMYPLIQNKVMPLLTADSVLVVEGGKNRGKLVSGDAGYDAIFSQLGPICHSTLRPVIHSDDVMWQFHDTDTLEHIKQSDAYSDLMLKLLIIGSKPSMWEDLIAVIKADKHDVKMRGALSKQWKVFARDLRQEFVQRDDVFVDQIKGYTEQGKDVLFIGGVLHCISLSVRQDWPVIRYPCTPENIQAFYHGWFQVYGVAGLFP